MSSSYRRAVNPPLVDHKLRRLHHTSIATRLVPRHAIAPVLRTQLLDQVAIVQFVGRRRNGCRNSSREVCFSALGEVIGDLEVEERDQERKRRTEVVAAAALTVVLGTGNRVLYKLALVPLKHYPFFLAQLATFGYVVVYFSILYFRYHVGIVTDEMLSLPKTPYLAVGLLEALGAASGMAAGAVLSGPSIPILSQTFLVWQLLLSAVLLGRRYRVNQIFGCFLVAIGVILTVASSTPTGHLDPTPSIQSTSSSTSATKPPTPDPVATNHQQQLPSRLQPSPRMLATVLSYSSHTKDLLPYQCMPTCPASMKL